MDKLRDPKGKFQETVRKLAEAAYSTLMHDVDDRSVEGLHAMQSLEEKFGRILRGKMKA